MDYIGFYSKHVEGLKREGKWFQGYCPFHGDQGSKLKGFVLNPENGLWKCYSGCHGGAWHNAITFCELKGLPLDQAPDYNANYRSYGFPGGAVYKKPHVTQKDKDAWKGSWAEAGHPENSKKPYNPEAVELAAKEQRPLWICEGMKDTETMLAVGELAIGLQSATQWKTIEGLSFEGVPEIIIAMDNDKAGREATEKLKDLIPFAKVLIWPGSLPKGWDVTDHKKQIMDEMKCEAKDFIDELREYVKTDTWQDEGSLISAFMYEVENKEAQYIKTGFKQFDSNPGGLLPGGLHVIQAASSVGKTTLCKQIADQVKAGNPDLPVFFFSLEDSLRTIRAMTFARLSSIENRAIRRGGRALSDKDISFLRKEVAPKAAQMLGRDFYLVAGEPGIDVRQIRERVERKLARTGKESALVIVDYLQILPTPKGERLFSLMDKIDFNLHELQMLARDINGPVILTSSTTKEDIKDAAKDARPGLVKGKGSVNILYTPRMLFELMEAPKAEASESREKVEMDLYVLKNSEGEKDFSMRFWYWPKYSRFQEPPKLGREP